MGSSVRDGAVVGVRPLAVGDDLEIACEIVPGETTWRPSVVTGVAGDWFTAKVVTRLAPTTEYTFYYAEEHVTWRRKAVTPMQSMWWPDFYESLGGWALLSLMCISLFGGWAGPIASTLLSLGFVVLRRRHRRRGCFWFDRNGLCWWCKAQKPDWVVPKEKGAVSEETTPLQRTDDA